MTTTAREIYSPDYEAACAVMTEDHLRDLLRLRETDDLEPDVSVVRGAMVQWGRHGEANSDVWACVRAIVDAFDGDNPAKSGHPMILAAYGLPVPTKKTRARGKRGAYKR